MLAESTFHGSGPVTVVSVRASGFEHCGRAWFEGLSLVCMVDLVQGVAHNYEEMKVLDNRVRCLVLKYYDNALETAIGNIVDSCCTKPWWGMDMHITRMH